jgi:hypothetical protein
MVWVVASAWASSRDYDKTRGCLDTHDGTIYDNWYKHCKGDFTIEQWKPGGCCRKKTRFGCAKACGNKIQYRRGQTGHPCKDATEIKGIPVNISMHDKSGLKSQLGNPQGAFWCNFTVDANKLKRYSKEDLRTSASDGTRSVYDQMLFGANKGSYKSDGFCSEIKNLNTVVHDDGRTCYDMISSAADKKAKGILYCKSNRTDPKCKCVNVSGNTFLQDCQNNPTWAGCKEILKGEADFKKMGLTSASGLYGNADCLSPGICSGDVYSPMTNLPACSNKNAICNQILKQDNIEAYAGLNTAQHCNINFEAEQAKKDRAKASNRTPSTPSGTPSTPSGTPSTPGAPPSTPGGGIGDYIPRSVDELKTDTKKQITVGGGLFLMCCCLLIIILLALSGGNGGGGGGRFRR